MSSSFSAVRRLGIPMFSVFLSGAVSPRTSHTSGTIDTIFVKNCRRRQQHNVSIVSFQTVPYHPYHLCGRLTLTHLTGM